MLCIDSIDYVPQGRAMALYDAGSVTVRLTPSLARKIQEVVSALRTAFPGVSFTASDALRTMAEGADVSDLLRPGLGAGAGAHREGR